MNKNNAKEYQALAEKYNADCESIINGMWNLLKGKDSMAAIECLPLILADLIVDNFKNKEEKFKVLNNLMVNLKSLLDVEKEVS